MGDILKNAVDWLDTTRNESMSQSVVYTRGVEFFTVLATLGDTEYEVISEDNSAFQSKSPDFLISAKLLVFGWDKIVRDPEIGDTITTTIDGVERVFEVLDLEGQGHFRPNDSYGKVLRIHTKEISGD